MDEALEAAQTYVDSKISQGKQLKKEMRRERAKKRKRKGGKKRKIKRELSNSKSSSTSGSTTDTSSSSLSSTSADYFSSSSDSSQEEKKKKKAKVSTTEKKAISNKMQDLESQFRKLNVNLAKTRPARRPIPIKRAYVWCSYCGEQGHYPHECPKTYPKTNQELEHHTYYTKSQDQEEEEDNSTAFAPCYAVQPPTQYFPRPPQAGGNANSNRPTYKPPMRPPIGYPPRGAPKERGTC
jgi:hypothetical protein